MVVPVVLVVQGNVTAWRSETVFFLAHDLSQNGLSHADLLTC